MSAPEPHIRRNAVVQCWGTPDETVGSLNEPRERDEHGVSFNEKWTYRLPHPEPEDPCARLVYWKRYDFVASFLVAADGSVERENAAVSLARSNPRVYTPPSAAR